ncbi:hypothetical protein HK100_010899 [Physocladia obscura]|uniref:Uncharacterized protein n=1 Tax=Physocladia obscura TaxID=109957 RepID=A0AAD5T3W6_9FUNG|nr:hypothetical protein HK100_010899 [Physocladia obscura]
MAVGYSLNPETQILAVAKSNSSIGSMLNLSVQSTIIELWNYLTGEKIVMMDREITSLPSIIGPVSHPLLSLSWSTCSEFLEKLFALPISNQSPPHVLIAGIDRLIVSLDQPILNDERTNSVIKTYVGENAAIRCTAAFQSSFDYRVQLIGICNTVYWIFEDEELDGESTDLIQKSTESIEKIESSDQASKVSQEEIGIKFPKMRIRRILTPESEAVIGLYHLKTYSIDAIIVATDFGTVAIYNIALPSGYLQETSSEVIYKDSPLLTIWHSKSQLIGMQVVDINAPQTKYEHDLAVKNEWRTVKSIVFDISVYVP